MSADAMSAARTRTERLRALAGRCRELTELTAVPELIRELASIADELEDEAKIAREDRP
jgi:hypothetical protein